MKRSPSWLLLEALLVPILFCSCAGKGRPPGGEAANTGSIPSPSAEKSGGIRLTTSAFQEGALIPKQYTCDGPNISPPLSWDALPEGARTLALTCEDPDAPGKTWTHWVVFNLPPATTRLPENVPRQGVIADGAKQGVNDFRTVGYSGPCPPGGTHRYYFKLYALDAGVALDAGASREQLLKAMAGHILGQGQLMGTYQR